MAKGLRDLQMKLENHAKKFVMNIWREERGK